MYLSALHEHKIELSNNNGLCPRIFCLTSVLVSHNLTYLDLSLFSKSLVAVFIPEIPTASNRETISVPSIGVEWRDRSFLPKRECRLSKKFLVFCLAIPRSCLAGFTYIQTSAQTSGECPNRPARRRGRVNKGMVKSYWYDCIISIWSQWYYWRDMIN